MEVRLSVAFYRISNSHGKCVLDAPNVDCYKGFSDGITDYMLKSILDERKEDTRRKAVPAVVTVDSQPDICLVLPSALFQTNIVFDHFQLLRNGNQVFARFV